MPAETGLLQKLAQLYGIQTAYYGIHHARNTAQTETLLAILQSLGAPIYSISDVRDAYLSRQLFNAQQMIEPVTVAWEGRLKSITIRLPSKAAGYPAKVTLFMEDGTQYEWQISIEQSDVNRRIEINNTIHYETTLSIRKQLPYGYHRLVIKLHDQQATTLVLSAPIKAFSTGNTRSRWGVFIPLYSLHSATSWGAGNYTDMEKLSNWGGELGSKIVATLPLLPTFLNKPYEPSPYLPISKLFWNEFYLDITNIPELHNCPDARSVINSSSFLKKKQSFQYSQLIDYSNQMALKKTVLEKLSKHFFSADSQRNRDFTHYLERHPTLEKYARFRAVMEKYNTTWNQWQERLQKENLNPGDYNEQVKQYHLYVQWLAHEQMNDLIENASRKDVHMCLDLPLGIHPEGFDTWQYRQLFINSVSVGAPPDIVFTRGQNWAFPPLRPDKIRETGYKYFIECIRHHLQYAKFLRIDHIMSCHRLFYIPKGFDSNQGTYVRYHPEELYAILSIESHRYKSSIIGEDLGIVPKVVRTSMNRHGIYRMWVLHYEMAGKNKPFLRNPFANSVASMNTHDMPPFASFWRGQDIIDREKTGIITPAKARKEKKARATVKIKLVTFLKNHHCIKGRITANTVFKGCLTYLAKSHSRLLFINMEDLWMETKAQNIPSTITEHPNWQRKARLSFEAFCQMPQIVTILGEVNSLRLNEGKKHAVRQTKKSKPT